MKKSSYHINEIANWTETKEVQLPNVQRGFVWKASQIENLWDSILRGYPLGSFVLSNSEGKIEILDGQQRATAIALGFNKETLRNTPVKLFVDLFPPDSGDARKFIFRAITKSHPWGYARKENDKVLSSVEIRHAMEEFDLDSPLVQDLNSCYPYDAKWPIPLYMVLENRNDSVEKLVTRLESWEHWEKLSTRGAKFLDKEIPVKQFLQDSLENLLYKARKVMDIESGQLIPALYLDMNDIIQDQSDDAENENDEIENLFVRLNSGGTPLAGEELNYSILKSHIHLDTQSLIESSCKSLIRPSRFITIAYRLFQHSGDKNSGEALTMRVRAKQFQRLMKDYEDFEKFLKKILDRKSYEKSNILSYVEEQLAWSENNPQGLPYVVYSKIGNSAPELLFLLLYRVHVKGDRFHAKQTLRLRMLGFMTLLHWFGRGENLRDHSKVLANIWSAAKNSNAEDFWSGKTIASAHVDGALLPFPRFKKTDGNNIVTVLAGYNAKLLEKFEKELGSPAFASRLLYNRELLLYSQRNFLELYFRKELFDLEDTIMPFDWDHISPNGYIYRKWNIPQVVKEWYQTNGNFRAWPFALNRSDSDSTPQKKLRPFQEKRGTEIDKELVKWNKLLRHAAIKFQNKSEVENCLLDWSFCGREWASCDISQLNAHGRFGNVVNLIVKRNGAIIENWYKSLEIDALCPIAVVDINPFLNLSFWRQSDILLGHESYDNETHSGKLSKRIEANGATIRFFLESEKGFNLLRPHGIILHVFKLHDAEFTHVATERFTLLSNEPSDLKKLKSSISVWLVKEGKKKNGAAFHNAFLQAVSKSLLK